MPAGMAPADVVAFYAAEAPMTGAGVLRYAEALTALGRPAEARGAGRGGLARDVAGARRARPRSPSSYPAVVAPLDVARARHAALARPDRPRPRGMLERLPADERPLAAARIAVRTGADGSTALIEALPATLRDASGPRLRALSLPRRQGPLGRGGGVSCSNTRPPPRRWASPTSGWSAGPISRATPCGAAKWRRPTRWRRRTSGQRTPARTTPTRNGWRASSR